VRPAWALAGSIGFLVVFSSILAVNALHTLMRRGEATRVTSLLYLTRSSRGAGVVAVRRRADAAHRARRGGDLRRRGAGGVAAAAGLTMAEAVAA